MTSDKTFSAADDDGWMDGLMLQPTLLLTVRGHHVMYAREPAGSYNRVAYTRDYVGSACDG
jgi:hypothetical protein